MHSQILTSMASLLLLAGVAQPGSIPYQINSGTVDPIVSRSQERRICAELCMTGLGGAACGDDCVDLTPQGLPLQSLNRSTAGKFGVATRHDACPVLCENNLGYPLCHCDVNVTKQTDFVEVCSFFCVRHDYRIYGCQDCALYKNATASHTLTYQAMSSTSEQESDEDPQKPVVNWDLWCQSMCQEGNGGAACNCDLLPMYLEV